MKIRIGNLKVTIVDAKIEPNLVRMVLQPQTRFPSSELIGLTQPRGIGTLVQVNLLEYRGMKAV
jgi:hypothetical protein